MGLSPKEAKLSWRFVTLSNSLGIKVVRTFTMNEPPQLLGHLMLSIEGKAEVSEEHHGVADFCICRLKRVYPQAAQIVVSSLVNCRTIEKRWVGMPVMNQRSGGPIILLDHSWGIMGWYMHYKFKEAQPYLSTVDPVERNFVGLLSDHIHIIFFFYGLSMRITRWQSISLQICNGGGFAELLILKLSFLL